MSIILPFYEKSVNFYNLGALLTNLKKFKSLISSKINCAPNSRTLDVCCGTCNFADLAKGEYIGVDLNQKYLAYARNKYRSDAAKKFIVADINDIKFAPKYFDNVFLISALHHLSDESAMRILEKVNKAAKGKIIISDPSIETSSPISKFLIFLDRGKFIRSLKDALSLISRSLTVIEYFTFYTGLAHKFIVVCQPRDT